MIPITKNIIVVDEQGNEYEATYPKRAKGLVKNGRARFIEENKICLACPPNKNLEDKKVKDKNIKSDIDFAREQIEKMIELLEKPNIAGDTNLFCNPQLFSEATNLINSYLESTKKIVDVPNEPNMKYILLRMDMVLKDKEHIQNAISFIKNIKVQIPASEEDYSLRLNVINKTVESREATLQHILKILEKMYDDLKPEKNNSITKFNALKESLSTYNEDEFSPHAKELLRQAVQMMF